MLLVDDLAAGGTKNLRHTPRGLVTLHMADKFGVFVDEDHSKLPTLYWLPKLLKRPYKSHFNANSSIELSII